MYSIVLESADKELFINLSSWAVRKYGGDILLSAGEFAGEGESVCGVLPSDTLLVRCDTDKSELKDFAFGDTRESVGFLTYDHGRIFKGIKSEKTPFMELGLIKKYRAYIYHKDSCLKILSDEKSIFDDLSDLRFDLKGADASIKRAVSNMTSSEYEDRVGKVLDYIRNGHTYQLNLSLMYEAELSGDALSLWLKLAKSYPAPFYAYIQSLNGEIISTSPERFIKCVDGMIISQPIKGTAYVASDEESSREKLVNCEKESAELSMIVDLIRNDISEFSKVGSVNVKGHKSVMRVDRLLQMYSSVCGEMREGADVIDILWGASPGGSITGCPKKRSMEIIESLEPHSRGIYCGSIFRIKDRQNMDSSIAIRTAYAENDMVRFFAGSGIVADSQPNSEYNETINKAEKFLRISE